MHKPLGIAVCTIATLGLLAGPGPAAPALADKPPKWEYAELHQRSTSRFGAREAAKGENEQPQPPAAGRTAEPTLRWVTGETEIEAKGWEELATKLKAAAAKKDGTTIGRRVQVMNHLGSEGWELVSTTAGTTATAAAVWTFKRRLP
ncbi:MAG TPA: hypothetical protein VKD90_01755 [Gemmataceae bacterium]|nr:hypothetical protein [Gemmataceae bacterium]